MYKYEPTEPPPNKRHAARAYTVLNGGLKIGVVILELAARPSGQTRRRDWWPISPLATPPARRPYPTRTAAATHLLVRWQRHHTPPSPPSEDKTLVAIRTTAAEAGPAAAALLANAITAHHLRELVANRRSHPAALWHEITRAATYLDAAMSEPNIYYRRTSSNPRPELET